MVCHSFASLVVIVTALFFLQVRSSPVIVQKRGVCATEDPDASFLNAIQRVSTKETQPDSTASEARHGPIEVATWFHIISSKAEAAQVSDDMINAQVNNALPHLCWPSHTDPPYSFLFYKTPTRTPRSGTDCMVSLVM